LSVSQTSASLLLPKVCGSRPVGSVRPGIACLPAPGREAADSPESSFAHHAALPLLLVVRGSTSPAAMNSRSADSGMRTWRPMRVKRIRRSAISRRGKRSEVRRTSATVSSRSDIPDLAPLMPLDALLQGGGSVGVADRRRACSSAVCHRCGRRRRAAAVARWACGPGRRI